jgi:hypothetical protein
MDVWQIVLFLGAGFLALKTLAQLMTYQKQFYLQKFLQEEFGRPKKEAQPLAEQEADAEDASSEESAEQADAKAA